MEFHPAKCQVLTVSRKRNPIQWIQTGRPQPRAWNISQYLGATFISDMKWGQRVNNITSKANKTLNFIRRNASTTKSSHHLCGTRMCRRISRKWRWYKGTQRDMSPTGITTHQVSPTCWTICNGPRSCSLETRRQQQRLVIFYKIHHGIVAVPAATYMTPATRISRHTHPLAYQVPTYATDYGRFSFFPRKIQDWNNLPKHVTEAPSPDSFGAHLRKGLQTT